jgi:hypothetical protein
VQGTIPWHGVHSCGASIREQDRGGYDMATVRARRAGTPEGRGGPGAGKPLRLPLTLADLITAVQDVVGPGDDQLVVATVRHLLRTGRLTWLAKGTRRCSSRSITGKEVKPVQGVVVGPGLVAVPVEAGASKPSDPGEGDRAAAGPSFDPRVSRRRSARRHRASSLVAGTRHAGGPACQPDAEGRREDRGPWPRDPPPREG